ncbi:MFS transporter, partial [Actinotignum timonense]
ANNAPIPKAFFIIAVIFAILSLLGYTALMNMTHERIAEAPKEESFNYSLVIKDAFRNRPLIGVMVATVGSLIYITGNSQLG